MEEKEWAKIKNAIEYKQERLIKYFEKDLKTDIKKYSRRSNGLKITLISLGAFSATQGAFFKLFGDDAIGVLISYSIIGIVIAAIAGFQTAFKYEERVSSIKQLAAEIFILNNDVFTDITLVDAMPDEEEKVKSIKVLLEKSRSSIERISEKAAQNNIGVVKLQELRDTRSE